MANEIEAQVQLSLTSNGTQENPVNFISGPSSFNQVGSRYLHQGVSVTTTAAALPLPGGTLGYCLVYSLDTSTNNEIYLLTTSAGSRFVRLLPGEFSMFKIGPDITTPYISALSTATQVELVIFEL